MIWNNPHLTADVIQVSRRKMLNNTKMIRIQTDIQWLLSVSPKVQSPLSEVMEPTQPHRRKNGDSPSLSSSVSTTIQSKEYAGLLSSFLSPRVRYLPPPLHAFGRPPPLSGLGRRPQNQSQESVYGGYVAATGEWLIALLTCLLSFIEIAVHQ